LAVSAPLVVTPVRVLWRTPYPISETVALLEDVDTSPASTGSLDSALVLFKAIEVAAVGGLIALLIWHLRPRTPIAAAAATLAVAVLVGTPGFRDNLELPLITPLSAAPPANRLDPRGEQASLVASPRPF